MKKKVILALLTFVFVLGACASNQTDDIGESEGTKNNKQDDIESNADTNGSIDEKAPKITSLSEISQDELRKKWETPIVVEFTLTNSLCWGGLGAAQWQEAEIDSTTVDLSLSNFSETLLDAIETLLDAIDEGLNSWEPTADMVTIKEIVSGDQASISAIFDVWMSHETTSADVIPLFEELCPQIESNGQIVVDAAIKDGISEETYYVILGDLPEILEDWENRINSQN